MTTKKPDPSALITGPVTTSKACTACGGWASWRDGKRVPHVSIFGDDAPCVCDVVGEAVAAADPYARVARIDSVTFGDEPAKPRAWGPWERAQQEAEATPRWRLDAHTLNGGALDPVVTFELHTVDARPLPPEAVAAAVKGDTAPLLAELGARARPLPAAPADALARPWRYVEADRAIYDDEDRAIMVFRSKPEPRVLARVMQIPELVGVLEEMSAYTAEGDPDEVEMHRIVDREERVLRACFLHDVDRGGDDA